MIDRTYLEVRERCPNAAVSWYLMASFAYYHADEALVSDGCYDGICRDLLARWDTIQHPHKHLLDRSALEAGTGFHLALADYPLMTRGAAASLFRGAPWRRQLPAELLAIDPVAPPPPPPPPPPPAFQPALAEPPRSPGKRTAPTAQGSLF